MKPIMIIVGEKLNSSIPRTLAALQAWDTETLVSLIEFQQLEGAQYLDLNTAMCEQREQELLIQLVQLVQEHSSCGIMLDSTSVQVLSAAAAHVKGRPLIFNSLTLSDRFEPVCQLAREYGAGVVALPIDTAMPHELKARCDAVDTLMGRLRENGIPDDNIYLDALVETLATDTQSARCTLDTIRYTREHYPQVHCICGVSNISFGLPKRSLINSAFLTMAMYCGLDSAILDPTSISVQDTLAAAAAVCGQDEYCMEYITYIRETKDN